MLIVGSRPPKAASLPAFYPAGNDFGVAPSGRTLITGGTVLSLDPALGDFTPGDVLIEGDRILAVGPNLTNGEVETIDASGMIVMPGFVDSHRHIWEGLLRNIGTDVPLEGRSSYISFVLHKLAPAFRPEDAYIGDLISALGAIDAGVTTLLDWSHIQGSPAHTDAVIQALKDSGLRAVFAYGFPWWGKWEERQPSWFVRAATEHFSTKDQMLTLALAAPGPEFTDFEVSRDHWKLARETDARITTHVGVGSYGQDAKVQEMGEAGLLGPDTTYIHCTTLNDTEIQMIVDTGGTVSLASPVEMMMGHGMPPIQKFLDRGLRPSLSVDVETNVPADMFNQMRSVLGAATGARRRRGQDRRSPPPRSSPAPRSRGPARTGSRRRSGRLTPGKKADIILLRTDRMNVTPLNDPATAVVTGMDTGQRRHGRDRRPGDETTRRAAARRLAGGEADGRRVEGPRDRQVGLQAPGHLMRRRHETSQHWTRWTLSRTRSPCPAGLSHVSCSPRRQVGLYDGRAAPSIRGDEDTMTTDGFPVATTPAPGIAGVDWEVRVDFERLRTYRLDRAKEALEASELGALLLFETSNIRYVTGTQIGYWAFNKGERYALLTRTGRPRIFDFGSAAKAHRLQLPHLYDETNSVGGNTGLQGAIHPRVGLAGARRAGDPVDHGRGRRGRHAARRRRRRDVDLPRARERRDRGPRRPAGDGRRARDQEPRRAHAADPGVRDGRRRLPGHLRGAEAGRPRERHRRPRARAAVRDGLGVRRGDQLDRGRAVQPAPARLLRPADPARRSGVLRHHPRLQRLPDVLLPHVRRRPRDARRSATRSSARASGWTPRSTS